MSDRFPKRRIILLTQATMMVQAFALALLVWTGQVRYWHVAVLALIYGLGRAVDIPARQAYITDLVGKPDLANAVALNSLVFNGARIVGPAVAGLLIARFGVAVAFLLNGLSFVAVLAALLATRTPGAPDPAGRLGLREGLWGALGYAARTPPVAFTLALLVVVSVLVLNFNVVVPLIAREVLNEGAHGFGLLMSSLGAGAVMAGVGLTLLRRGRPPLWFLAGSAAVLSAGTGALSLVGHFGATAALLVVLGMLPDPVLDGLQHHAAARHAGRAAGSGDGPVRAGQRRDDAVRVAPRRHRRRAPGRARGVRAGRGRRPRGGGRSRAGRPAQGPRLVAWRGTCRTASSAQRLRGAGGEGQQAAGVVDEDGLDFGLGEAAAAHQGHDVGEDVAVAVAAPADEARAVADVVRDHDLRSSDRASMRSRIARRRTASLGMSMSASG